MAEDRLKALLAIAEAQPEEVMIWYGLANEYVKLERWQEAVDALRRTVALNPDYTSAYQMLDRRRRSCRAHRSLEGARAHGTIARGGNA